MQTMPSKKSLERPRPPMKQSLKDALRMQARMRRRAWWH